jgi:hypothetical protein
MGGSVGAGAFVLGAGRAGASTATMTVWTLSPDWGTPRGPHGKMRLHSNASRRAAANRYALTRADAEAMNLHKCSFAPAVPVTVDAAAFMALWNALAAPWTSPWSGTTTQLIDLRWAIRLDNGDELVTRALAPAGPAPAGPLTPDGAARPVATDHPTDAAAIHQGGAQVGGRRLALTGSDPRELVALGFGALVAGATALRSRRSGSTDT